MNADRRLDRVTWEPALDARTRRRATALLVANVVFAAWYFGWLLRPERVGNPILFTVLVAAEAFNVVQAVGFWWTTGRRTVAPIVDGVASTRFERADVDIDVLIPVYDEPLEIVSATIVAATRLPGARLHVAVLDDGNRAALAELAERHGARYIRRGVNTGAKAGNLNHALARTKAPYVLVLDCDHVPGPKLVPTMLARMTDERVAFVQAPQYYANAGASPVARAAWAQQALFFGPIACGKDHHRAMFCCGTNVLFRRAALDDVGGFPEHSITEDFELSVRLHERRWESVYVSEVVARGLGPEDMTSYVSQQQRWATGCLSALPAVVRARLPWRLRLQYLLSASYFLSGWAVLVYMALPVVRILTGAQPVAGASADQFLLHFAPYFMAALLMVAWAGAGAYTFAAFSLASASFWIGVQSTLRLLLRRPHRFVVTPKQGATVRQPRAVWPALAAIAVMVSTMVVGLARPLTPAMLNNVSFLCVHVIVLAVGVSPALRRIRAVEHERVGADERVAA